MWGKAFKGKDAGPIAAYLLVIFRDNLVTPQRWHADNGGEFKNYHMDAVRELLAVNCTTPDELLEYSHSMPRNPQCQGLVERGNRTLKGKLLKQLAADGYVAEEHTTWDFRPYLQREIRRLNRKIIKLYGVSACVMMTGQPPEAPDHISLLPLELAQLHLHCADAMVRQARSIEQKPLYHVFHPGDVVLVHQISRRSHKDLRGIGNKSYPARAVIISRSTSNETHYKIVWTTDGLHAKEKANNISQKMWPAWRLKLCQVTKAKGCFYSDEELQAFEDETVRCVLEDAPPQNKTDACTSSDSEDMEPPLRDHEEIALRADR
jgi:hypothetical protein